jgi:NAD(P)-dependent dehydrogenase (short-subunit alcohol dehydrogenase family)
MEGALSRTFGSEEWGLILGGSSGFGLATAHKLAAHGMNLALVHRDRRGAMHRIEPEFEKLRGAGVQLRTWNADALDPAKRAEIVGELGSLLGSGRVKMLLHSIAFGNLKLLVAEQPRPSTAAAELAAALGVDAAKLVAAADQLVAEGRDELAEIATPPAYPSHSFLDTEDFARTIHCMGTSLLDWVQDLHRERLFAADARVFGLTSEGNEVAWKGYAAVSAAKVSLEALARSIAMEFAPYGIRCNVLQPGVTETPALAAIPGSDRLKAHARLRNPFRRLTMPRDVANVVYLLCLDEAAWITGERIRVDGGEHVAGSPS